MTGLIRMLSGGLWRCGDLGLRKWLNAVRGAQWDILVGTWETAVPRAVWTLEAQLSVSARNSISKWTGAHTRDILAKNRSTFCPCPKNLPEAKLKRN